MRSLKNVDVVENATISQQGTEERDTKQMGMAVLVSILRLYLADLANGV